MGLRVGGVDKLTYNHCDSYPDGLGRQMVDDIHELLNDAAALRASAEALRMVADGSRATEEDVKRLKQFSDTDVSTRQLDDWYVLLRETQGSLVKILEAGVAIENSDFAADSLFCEWGYVANLDDQVLEIYKGFQEKAHDMGRFASMPPCAGQTDYWPIALVGTVQFYQIAENADVAFDALMTIAEPAEQEA